MSCRSCTLYIALVVLVATCESFAPVQSPSLSQTTTITTSTSLQLKTNQGSQLVAAWNAAHAHDDDEDDENHHHVHQQQSDKKQNAARAFVSRVFSIPSSMIRRHPHPQEEGLEDVVYYPIVGFRFCPTDETHSVAVPTTNCNASINLHLEVDQEPVYGWYTPEACSLGDIYSEDYCSAPSKEEEANLTP